MPNPNLNIGQLKDCLTLLRKTDALLGQNLGEDVRTCQVQGQNYGRFIHFLLKGKSRELSHERRLQESFLIENIPAFIKQVYLPDVLRHVAWTIPFDILGFFKTKAVREHLSQIDHRPGFFNRIRQREVVGEARLLVISQFQNLSTEQLKAKWFEFLITQATRAIFNTSEEENPIPLQEYIQKLKSLIATNLNDSKNLEDRVRQQMSSFDEAMYCIYRFFSDNQFYKMGHSIFSGVELYLKEQQFKNIPFNVELRPSIIRVNSMLLGLFFFYTSVSQLGMLGTFLSSAFTQATSNLEFLTWVGAQFNQSPEETMKVTQNLGFGFALNDIGQLLITICQVLMELSDKENSEILRTIAGTLLILFLAKRLTGFVSGRMENSGLMPMVSICSFFAAIRFFSYTLNWITYGITLLYAGEPKRLDFRTADPVACRLQPDCLKDASDALHLPPGGAPSPLEVNSAFRRITLICHPDTATAEVSSKVNVVQCLDDARAAKRVLVS
jgi:hypothetical protein